MKKLTLLLFFIGGLVSIQAQESTSNSSINEVNRTLILKFGVNLVDSTGDQDPFTAFSDFDQLAFSDNYNVELEYRFSKWFSLAAAYSNNKWKANEGVIDGRVVSSDEKYLAIDLDLKYYYGAAFGGWFDRNDWIELYLHGGVGAAYQGSHTGVSLNFGPGANFWISEEFGVNLNGTGKWKLNNVENLYNSDHFQYSASLMYRFVDNDDDNDGVKNKVDNCPNVPGISQNNGCPEEINDRDGDGIVDEIDSCPDEYGAEVGCPKVLMEADSDGDSVLDSADKCPKIKGLPTNNGCPLPDSDNDGIVDSADKCPKAPGIATNNGCPYDEVKINRSDMNLADDKHIDIQTEIVLFNTGSASFRKDSYPTLMKIVKIMKQHPEVQFKIEGHADSVGSDVTNKRLSEKRANMVRSYLIKRGIPSENLMAEGFGLTRSVASNSTEEGRRKNRRVEVIKVK